MMIQDDYANLKYNKYLDEVSSALEFYQEDKSKYQTVANDIINISNLIIKDGYDEIKFIHKSIAEFFTAKFIATKMPKNKVDDYYSRCLLNVDFNKNFLNVLKFLEEIDQYNYLNKYYLKGVSGVLGLNLQLIDNHSYELSSDLITLFLNSTYIRVGVSYSHGLRGRRVEEYYLDKPEFLYGINSDFQSCYHTLFEKAYQKLSLDRNESQFCRKLANVGIYEDCGKICRLTLGGTIRNLGLTIPQIENALRLSIVELYMNKYNKSLAQIKHLDNFIASSNVFKF